MISNGIYYQPRENNREGGCGAALILITDYLKAIYLRKLPAPFLYIKSSPYSNLISISMCTTRFSIIIFGQLQLYCSISTIYKTSKRDFSCFDTLSLKSSHYSARQRGCDSSQFINSTVLHALPVLHGIQTLFFVRFLLQAKICRMVPSALTVEVSDINIQVALGNEIDFYGFVGALGMGCTAFYRTPAMLGYASFSRLYPKILAQANAGKYGLSPIINISSLPNSSL